MATTNDSVAFWKGVRLWQYAKCLRVQPAPAGAISPKPGLSRRRARLDSRSPSFAYQIMVPCWAPSISGDHGGSRAALSGMGRQVTRQVYVSKTLEFLIDNSGGTAGPGYLAWIEDESEYLTVAAPASGGTTVQVQYSGAGFAPATGNLVLFRNKTTGAGFVTTVTATAAGPTRITVNLQRHSAERDPATGEPVAEDVDVTTDWTIHKVAYYYDKVAFASMSDPEVPTQVEDKAIFNIAYQFLSEGGILYPSAYSPDFS